MDGIQMLGEAAFNFVDAITPTAFDDAMGYQAAQMDNMIFAMNDNAYWQRQQMEDIAAQNNFRNAMNMVERYSDEIYMQDMISLSKPPVVDRSGYSNSLHKSYGVKIPYEAPKIINDYEPPHYFVSTEFEGVAKVVFGALIIGISALLIGGLV